MSVKNAYIVLTQVSYNGYDVFNTDGFESSRSANSGRRIGSGMPIRAFNVAQQLRLVRQTMGNSRLQSDGLLFNRIVERRFDSTLFSGNAADCRNRIFGSLYNVFHLRSGYDCFDGTDAILHRVYEFTAP